MIIRHSLEQVNDYYERVGINQSSLKIILEDGIQAFIDKRNQLMSQEELYEEKRHFVIGSAYDCKMTLGNDVFTEKYHLSRLIKKPGATAMAVIKMAYDLALQEFPSGLDINFELYKKQVFEAANAIEYYKNRRNKDDNYEADTRINSLIKENGQAYWADLVLAEGKQVLDEDETRIVDAIYISTTTHKHTEGLFKDSDTVDIVYQLPIYFTYGPKSTECKVMIDMIRVDHKRKRIMPIDLKTTVEYVLNFNRAIRKRRYDLQGSYYYTALCNSLPLLSKVLGKDVTKYSVANFAFIVESTYRPGTPMVYILTDELINVGAVGNKDLNIKGWAEGLEIYQKWEEHNFSVESLYESSNGIIRVDKDYNYLVNP